MEQHRELSDNQFLSEFKNAELTVEFSHEAHLRLAYLHIKSYGLEESINSIHTQLKAYVTKQGAEDKYNKTLTVAAIYIVKHFMNKAQSNNFNAFLLEFPQLKSNFMALVKTHYGFDIFNSEKSKKEYIEPDLIPFN